MTREEAINQLKVWAGVISNKTRIKALEMAIEALETEAAQQTPLSGYDFPEGGFHEN